MTLLSLLLVACDSLSHQSLVGGSSVEAPEASAIASYELRVAYDREPNVGTIAVGGTAERRMRLTNKTSEDLTFWLDRVSCSCISVDTSAGVISAGETREIAVTASVSRPGPSQRHGARFAVSRGTKESTSEEPTFIVAEIEFTPHASFEVYPLFLDISARARESIDQTIVLYRSVDASHPKVVDFESDLLGIDAQINNAAGFDGTLATLDIYGEFTYKPTPQTGWVYVLTNDEEYAKMRLPISVNVLPRVRASPGSLVLCGDAAESKQFVLSDVVAGDLPVSVEVVDLYPSSAELSVVIDGQNGNPSVDVGLKSESEFGSCFLYIYNRHGELLIDVSVSWIND